MPQESTSGPPGGSFETVVSGDARALAEAAAARIAAALEGAIRSGRLASLVLAGGSTPRMTYSRLADRDLDWNSVDVYWGDERCVAADDPQSNFQMADEALLAPAAVTDSRIHRIRGEMGALRAARDYEARLRGRFSGEWPRFDVVLLGIGADGHVASLFPGARLLPEARWVVPFGHAPDGLDRVSLSLSALVAAETIVVLASGGSKAEIVRRVLVDRDPSLPATAVLERAGNMLWYLDRDAAAGLV